MTICADCSGAGWIIGYACPGFRRVEVPCDVCGATGIAPDWQEAAKRRGAELRAIRLAAGHSLTEQARLDGIASQTSQIELGRLPIAKWPRLLRGAER